MAFFRISIIILILAQTLWAMPLDSLRTMRESCAQEIADAIITYESNNHGQQLDAKLNQWDLVKNQSVLFGTLALYPNEDINIKSTQKIKRIVANCVKAIRNNTNDMVSSDFTDRLSEKLGSNYESRKSLGTNIHIIRKKGISGKFLIQDQNTNEYIDPNIVLGDMTHCLQIQCKGYSSSYDPEASGLDPFVKIYIPSDREAYKKLCPQDELGSRQCNISDSKLDKAISSLVQVNFGDLFYFKYPSEFRYTAQLSFDNVSFYGLNDRHTFSGILRWNDPLPISNENQSSIESGEPNLEPAQDESDQNQEYSSNIDYELASNAKGSVIVNQFCEVKQIVIQKNSYDIQNEKMFEQNKVGKNFRYYFNVHYENFNIPFTGYISSKKALDGCIPLPK